MLDSTVGHERRTDVAGLAMTRGDRGSAERALRSAIQALEGADESPPELASSLIKLAALKQEMGEHAEADALVARALAVGESHLGENHPDLVILLNDLTRLCLKQSAYAVAEPLLLRLLAIKRSKGEDHPEVATVLGSLAGVRQALGHHESAEQLWRRVLDIRERTLAPNHFALATTLEHLADSCAARGKTGEALRFYQRALTIRELTLGVDHSSLRSSRERIADLQLQASEDLLDAHDVATPPAGDTSRLVSPEGRSTPAPSRPAREKTAFKHLRNAKAVVDREPSTTSITEQQSVPVVVADTAIADAITDTITETEEPQSNPAPYRDILLGIEEELKSPNEGEPLAGRAAATYASVLEFLRERRKAIVVGVGAMAFLLIGLGVDTHAWNQTDKTAFAEGLPAAESPAVAAASMPAIPDRPLVSTGDAAKISAPANVASTPKLTPPRSRLIDQPGSGRKGSERSSQAGISIPTLRDGVMVGLDSVGRVVNAPSRTAGDTFTVQLAPTEISAPRPSFLNNAESVTPQRARLMGDIPTPRVYPGRNSGAEGEVVVRFTVDVTGRPVMSTLSVVKSPDALLTDAVRKVVPGMRFEPARTGAPDSKPTVDVVEMSFQFRSSK